MKYALKGKGMKFIANSNSREELENLAERIAAIFMPNNEWKLDGLGKKTWLVNKDDGSFLYIIE